MTFLASKIFKRKWFKDFDGVFTKNSSRFHKLKLLVSKIVKAFYEKNIVSFVSLIKQWSSLNDIKSLIIQDFIDFGASFDYVHSAPYIVKKFYYASKLAESLRANKANIRSAINKRIESFVINKDYTIRSILECSFCKMVLDYLVVDNELIIKPDVVKSKVDVIMESWTRKHDVVTNIPNV
ncbi:hypothetical protein G9A89_007117 [Geosiphon pyriformis]|nr:hypothetical protein G9A89_007117 [Geosiphon pyriformis]